MSHRKWCLGMANRTFSSNTQVCCFLINTHISHWTVHYRISHSDTQSKVQHVIFYITKRPLAMRKQQQFLSPLQIKNKFRKCTYTPMTSHSPWPHFHIFPIYIPPLNAQAFKSLYLPFIPHPSPSQSTIIFSTISNSSSHSSSSTSATQQPPGAPQANNTKKCKK